MSRRLNNTDTNGTMPPDPSGGHLHSWRMTGYLTVAKYAVYIRREILVRALLGILQMGALIAGSLALARLFAAVLEGQREKHAILPVLIVIGSILLRTLLTAAAEIYAKKTGGRIKAVLREKMIHHLMDLGPAYLEGTWSGKIQSLVTDGVEYLEPFFAQYLPQLVTAGVCGLVMVAMMCRLSVSCGLLVLLCMTAIVLTPHLLMKLYLRVCLEYWRDYAALNARFIDRMQGMNTLKVFGAGGAVMEELRKYGEAFRKKQLANTGHSLLASSATFLFAGIIMVLVPLMALRQYQHGQLTLGAVSSLLFLSMEAARPVTELNTAWHSCMMGFSVSEELVRFLDTPSGLNGSGQAVPDVPAESLPAIRFDHVTYSYADDREKALSDLTFDVRPGEMMAVVGLSGSGKSTLVHLLLRFADPEEGKVFLGDNDLALLSPELIRSRISVVFQNTYLFYGTVSDNIREADRSAGQKAVKEAAENAGADAFIRELPEGYDTMLGERGNNLSGGQRQRIAIARAILKKAPMLILDEATSSVDPVSEAAIVDTLNRMKGKYTILMIAHRLSTIRDADRIAVLKNGQLCVCGTREEVSGHPDFLELQRGQEMGIVP